jgi:hypothetical protein
MAIAQKVETQVWYMKNGIITTYSGHWMGPVREGKNGPFQLFKIKDMPSDDVRGPYRTFTLRNIVKVCEDGKQVWPIVKPAKRARNGRFVKAEA